MEKFKGLLAVITFVLVISLFTTPVFAAAVATTEPPYRLRMQNLFFFMR